jgi:hypothetical protein
MICNVILTLREKHGLGVFENRVFRVLRRIFGPKTDGEVSWRKLYGDELHDLYSLPNTLRVIKSRRMGWAVHVARMGRGEVFKGFWLGGPKGRDHWEDVGLGGRIVLRWT